MSEDRQRNDVDDDLLEEEDEEDTLENKYLTFMMEREEFGVEIRHVREIVGMQYITDMPDLPEYVNGVINLRGKVIPVMDVRLRFGLESQEYDERTCIIVITVGEQMIGLIVDRVSEVLNIDESCVEEAPDLRKNHINRYISGLGKVGDKVKILLNVEKLLFE